MALVRGRGLASHLLGRAVLQAAVRVLEARAIPVMPLKGIWLQQVVYADPGDRLITDVDVLIPDDRYEETLDVLRAAGWSMRGSNVSEAALLSPDLPLLLDVHRRLFTRGAFRMPSSELFARGGRDRKLYEVEVVLPDPRDVFAHLVGHFVKSRGGRDTQSHELRDLPALAVRFAFEPAATARHLERCGLGRASRYALQFVSRKDDPTGFCAATVECLRNDVVGDCCAATMLRLRSRYSAQSALAALPGFVLDDSLPRGLSSLALRVWDRRSHKRLGETGG